MNAIFMDTADTVGSYFTGIFAKINRTIYKIGYRRAASELARLGYHQEARNCIEQLNSLR